jgi:hypothetical protein
MGIRNAGGRGQGAAACQMKTSSKEQRHCLTQTTLKNREEKMHILFPTPDAPHCVNRIARSPEFVSVFLVNAG